MKKEGNSNEIKYSQIKEYADGEPSKEQAEQIASWFENPELRFKLEHYLRELWKETNPARVDPPTGLHVILDRIHHKINLLQPRKESPEKSFKNYPARRLSIILKYFSRVAAILLFPIMVYLGWEVLDQKMWKNSQAEVVYNEIFCPMGARSRFKLPDGTSGWLNNGSRLKYPVKFPDGSREVELIGEAYFDVAPQNKRPFIINTSGLDVKVLGTRLNVSVYPDDKVQAFTLEEGSIELIRRKGSEEIPILKMKPGQHAVYAMEAHPEGFSGADKENSGQKIIHIGDQELDKETDAAKVTDAYGGRISILVEETSQYTEWKNGKLILRNDPMPAMLKRIERWYNVKFNITDERINQYRYWATFEEENLDQVLKMLSLTGPLRFKEHEREQKDDGTLKAQEIDILIKDN